MRGTKKDFVSERQQALIYRLVELPSEVLYRFFAQKVGAAHPAGHESVAAERRPHTSVTLAQHVAHVARRVPGCCQGAKTEAAHSPLHAIVDGPSVLVVKVAVRVPDLGSSPTPEFQRSNQIVFVAVCLQDMAQPVPGAGKH